MATPSTAYTTISVLESTDSAQSVELSIQREYTITHTGLTKAGAAGLEPVMLSLATAAFSYAGGNDQYILQRGDSVIIGPMVGTLYYIAHDTTSGLPTLCLAPSSHQYGDF